MEDALLETDWLSNLPDSVLYHILSFLETKLAVQTSVLSRRWRNAWKDVPTLDIRSESFREYASFRTYVDKVLSLRNPLSLQKITLIDEGNPDVREASLLARVVEYGLSHDAQHFVIDLENSVRWKEDTEYFFSELFGTVIDCNLRTLKLDTMVLDVNVGFRSSGFWMLTKLELIECMFWSDDEEYDPFSEFPCLEHLVLESSSLGDYFSCDRRLRISGLRLLSLSVTDTYFTDLGIHAPRLKHLYFHKLWGFVEFTEMNLPSLENAEISVADFAGSDEDYAEYAKDGMISLLQGLSNAKTLTLCCFTIEVLNHIPEFPKQPSPFTRLKTLSLGSHDLPDAAIDYFVKGSSGAKPIVKFE